MNDVTFDGLTRRASLLGLGVAGAAALATPITSEAKNKGKKKAKKKCRSQVEPCTTILTAFNCSGGDPDCIAQIQLCCQLVGTCDFNAFVACLST
jgi:hypothetical protein